VYKNKSICIIVPAFNEAGLIAETLSGIPEYVDSIIAIDDSSTDGTGEILNLLAKSEARLKIISHKSNQGLGQSLINGYVASRDAGYDITAVMAGDNQMHPDDLPVLLDAIVEKKFDYVKGNRLLHRDISSMPTYRFFGNSILTILTKFATGFYSLMDPQCGYTAIEKVALSRIPIESMTKGYGYNADILCMLNILRFSVTDVEVRPVYDREKSKIVLKKYIFNTSWILLSIFVRRMWKRYIVLDFHPLVLFLFTSLFLIFAVVLPFSIRFLYLFFLTGAAPTTTLMIIISTLIPALQLALFALWMDMDYNRKYSVDRNF
jgi:glycosyltransferase involved in cell wall biosynthesis